MFKKRAIALIMFVIIGITVIMSFFSKNSLADEKEVTFEQYKADYYLDYSPYEYYMSSKFTLPYRTIVEKNRNSKTYQTLINAWQVATFNLSNVTDYSKKRIGYYETFLFDILYTGYEPKNLTKEMNHAVKSVQASSMKKVSKLVGESASTYAKMNLSKMSSSDLDKLSSALNACDEMQNVFGAIGNVSTVLNYASNVEELIYKLAKIEAISHLSNDNAVVLKKVAENTSDTALSAACLELAAICSNQLSKTEIITLMSGDMVATEMANWALGEIWKGVVEKVSGYGIAISLGQSLGKWSSGLLFSTDKEIETYYEMCALYDFEDELKKVVSSYGKQYSRTHENAKLYNTAFELLLKTFQLGCDISIDYAAVTYDSGAVNLFISYVFGNHEKFEKYKKSLENIKKEIGLLYDFANGDLYNSYRDTYCLDVADTIEMNAETVEVNSEDVDNNLENLKQDIFACCDVVIDENMTLTEDLETYGDLYLNGGTLDLDKCKLTVNGTVHQSGGNMKINGGTLDISGDYIIAKEEKNSVTDEFEYQGAGTGIHMSKEADTVNVAGNFYICAYSFSAWGYGAGSDFSAGTMTVGGDFTQKSTAGGDEDSFAAKGSHTVILNGKKHQKVFFDSTSSHFNILVLTKNKDTGYTFIPDNCWNTLQVDSGTQPHNHIVVVDKSVAPTCTETGLTEGKHCSECNKVIVKQEVLQALGHNYVNGICLRCNAHENNSNASENKNNQNTDGNNTSVHVKGQKLIDSKTKADYKIISAETNRKTVEYTKPLNNTIKSVSIPATITVDGISYKVTSIAANAFKNNKKLSKAVIGKMWLLLVRVHLMDVIN